MKNTRKNDTDQAASRKHGAIHCLGTFMGASYNLAGGAGRFLLDGPFRALSRLLKSPKRSAKPEKFPYTQEAIRSIVMAELAQLKGMDRTINLVEFEKRLRVMSEAIEALQVRITELVASGPIGAAEMQMAIGSIKAAESLTNVERTMLVNVFRQNMVIQKPELFDTAIVE